MSKQDEVWNHSIIKTRADLKIWLAYEIVEIAKDEQENLPVR